MLSWQFNAGKKKPLNFVALYLNILLQKILGKKILDN